MNNNLHIPVFFNTNTIYCMEAYCLRKMKQHFRLGDAFFYNTPYCMLSTIYYTIFVFCIAVLYSCHPARQGDEMTIKKVNDWYSQQNYYAQLNRGDSVLHYALLIEAAAKNLPVAYQAMAVIGKARYNVGKKIKLSVKLYEQSLGMLEHTKADSLIGRAYNGLGVSYIKMSDYSNALEYYFKALRLFEKINDTKGIGGVLANIGEVYQVKNDLPTAKKYILRSMEVNKAKYTLSYLDAAQTLANIYGMNNQFDSALAIDKMGIRAADSIGATSAKSTFYNNMGNCYMYSNRPDSAFYYFNQCLIIDAASRNLSFMVDNYLTLGDLAFQQKQLMQSEQYFLSAIALSDSIHENQAKYQAWKQLANLYRQQNNLTNAINAKDSATAVKDRIINEKSENKIAELQELYETEKKEQTIALQQSKLSKQQLLLVGSAVLMASLLFSGWLMYRRYTIKKEKELQASLIQQREKATLDILHAEDQERRRIAAELHDGVGQVMIAAWMNLQVLESQLVTLDLSQQQLLAKATLMVGEGCKEVREVSHAMMPNALLNKGLIGAIRDFTQQIDSKVIAINLHTEGLNEPMEEIVETILYRVIQESVNNTIRHANANQLDISIHNNPDGISLLIEDNGKGFDTNRIVSNDAKSEGLGLQNIKSRIAFLNGTVQWDSSANNGTLVSIYIPAKNEKV